MQASTLEVLTDADLDAARAIYNHYVEHSTATFAEEPLTPDEFGAEVRFADTARYGAWGVQDADGTLVGYVVLAPHKSRCAYRGTAEISVYLAPSATGAGLGGRAIDFAVDTARGRGMHALLAVICAENENSLRSFGARGFTEVGRLREVGEKFGRRLDVAILERLLA